VRRQSWFVGVSVVALLSTTLFAATPPRPNFVLILGEGQGWSSTSVQMDDTIRESKSDLFQTPSLEKLAQQGMRFASAYASLPRCTPSLAGLFTGKNPALMHMTFVGEGGGNRESGCTETGSKTIPPRCLLELPDTAKELDQRLSGYLAAVNAQMPTPNLDCDPSKAPAAKRDRKGKDRKKPR
jgi:arylsulfatase A